MQRWILLIHLVLLGAVFADLHLLNVYVFQWVCL